MLLGHVNPIIFINPHCNIGPFSTYISLQARLTSMLQHGSNHGFNGDHISSPCIIIGHINILIAYSLVHLYI